MPYRRLWLPCISCLLLSLALVGCGDRSTAQLSGTIVTDKGEKVTGGFVALIPTATKDNPKPGKPAETDVRSDGTFTLQAIIGPNKISYSPPIVNLPEGTILKEGEAGPKSPYHDMIPKTEVVEVKAGGNTIKVELVPVPTEPPPNN